ncbi:hypothetical protein BDQ12DRAFT_692175 [Crucibulum laeve]|uniref:Uncharacterized protein n=1 Tax=Crucibulum laeve TaxID=68775 RepID=A0A5C3LHT3_9AGAR|nr:hypothetical protein BDQ12DRAFT_692175 [Crucibulum laeve]
MAHEPGCVNLLAEGWKRTTHLPICSLYFSFIQRAAQHIITHQSLIIVPIMLNLVRSLKTFSTAPVRISLSLLDAQDAKNDALVSAMIL